ncbi:hypothetical protein LL033_11920 [Clostridium estertheticum]|uniref:hypothetical protein n=1 Tax=Clostridium estertheticum TaxID=238834 RepID=UPI001C0B9282|nr:hypothetical protein [Clostridium estertheticum]MBU3215858.1 hypothetical protein [Clostridium estertheticum]WAG57814.1 hypothetical protein LL033_11920 [Clostridium estertheticum]
MAKEKKVVDEAEKVSPMDFKNSIMDCLSNRKLYEFVKWYCTSDQSKESYDAIKHLLNGVEYDYAMSNHLTRSDIQEAIKLWTKKTKDMNMLKVYNVMLNKALEGDVKSADWLSKFNSSDFFKEEEDSEIHDFMAGLNVDMTGEENE